MTPSASQPFRSETDPDLAVVALGSNLGDSRSLIQTAMDRLEDFSEKPLLRSSLWETEPVDCPPGSPLFVNAVAGLFPLPGETPESLLRKLQSLEKEFGRQREGISNAPRPLDLDLICFGNEIRNRQALTLPHPRAHSRKFVLAPLAEIAPDLKWPGQDFTVFQLLNKLNPGQTARKITR